MIYVRPAVVYFFIYLLLIYFSFDLCFEYVTFDKLIINVHKLVFCSQSLTFSQDPSEAQAKAVGAKPLN